MSDSMPEKLDSESVRRGVPFTIYFSAEQARALAALSRERRVSKSTVLRFALERLFEQLKSGQLKFPFGM
jgi:hypothetical protein